LKTPSKWEFGREVDRLRSEYLEQKRGEDECGAEWELISADADDISDSYVMVRGSQKVASERVAAQKQKQEQEQNQKQKGREKGELQ
jgi:hypothetical protein